MIHFFYGKLFVNRWAVICGLQINWYEIQADLKQDAKISKQLN